LLTFHCFRCFHIPARETVTGGLRLSYEAVPSEWVLAKSEQTPILLTPSMLLSTRDLVMYDGSILFDLDRFAGLPRPLWPCRMLAGDCQDQAIFVRCWLIGLFLFCSAFPSSSYSRFRSLALDRPIDSVSSLLLFASCVRSAVGVVDVGCSLGVYGGIWLNRVGITNCMDIYVCERKDGILSRANCCCFVDHAA
jgi:hypothetical protein